jgi:hypothetical protein
MLALKPLLMTVATDSVVSVARSWMEGIVSWLSYKKKDETNPQDQNPKPVQLIPSASLPQADQVYGNDQNDKSGALLPAIIARIVKVDEAGKILGFVEPEQNVMQTKERFIVEYSANMPGILISQNKDSKGIVTDLDFNNNVGPTAANKIPMDDVSYRLAGDTGIETFRILFLPCLDGDKKTNDLQQKDLVTLLASATSAGGEFARKGIIKDANAKATSNAQAILTPVAMKSLTNCNKTLLDAATKQEFGSLGSKFGVKGLASIAQGKEEGGVVELQLIINHQNGQGSIQNAPAPSKGP